MNLILIGPQGSGKGTIAKKIANDFGLVPISTGDLFREHIAKGDELGVIANSYISRGNLVPLDLTMKILKARLKKADCKAGVILDGFPRTLEQAEALKKVLNVDCVINLTLERKDCIKRMLSRRVCPNCGKVFSTILDRKRKCDSCGAKLVQRDDDKLDAIKTRLEVYDKTTTPLIDFYSDRLLKVSAAGSPDGTYKPVKNFLTKLGRRK